jgi:2-phosphosulfolactate phosphatase
MSPTLEVLFSPADFMALERRDLSETVCVVFDVLRATSSMMTALANGARSIIPVAEIDEALALRQGKNDLLLAGERDGLRIRAAQTKSIDFDLGNSPREFTPGQVMGKTIVMTTTNGTRALRACAPAKTVLIGSFLALKTLGEWVDQNIPSNLLLVCAGTFDQTAYEDVLAAGALCDLVWRRYENSKIDDAALIARKLYHDAAHDLLGAVKLARNGRRLLSRPELRDDLTFSIQRDIFTFLARMTASGSIVKV